MLTMAGLSLRDLEYVVAVADHLHFGKAAQACAVSQPTLSAQVKKLEEYLGVEFFERASRQVLLTPRGEALVQQARLLLAEGRRLFELAQAGAEPLSGPFRLGIITTLGPYLMPLLLAPLRERFPQLQLLLTEGLTLPLVQALERGQIDALLAASPVREAELAELPLFHEPFVLAVPRDHPLATVARVTMADVPAAELILLGEGHCLRDHTLVVCPGRDHGTRRDAGLQASSLETLRQMVGAGIGCSLLPQLAVQVGALLDDMVAYRRLSDGGRTGEAGPGRDIALFHRQSFGRIREVRLLRDLIRDRLDAVGNLRVHRTTRA